MKSIILHLFLFLLPTGLFASDWELEVRAGYFHPNSKALRECFSGGWFDYQVIAAYNLDCHADIYFGMDWLSKRKDIKTDYYSITSYEYNCYYSTYDFYGHYEYDHKKALILPFTLGSRYYFNFSPCFEAYVGAGVTYTVAQFDFDYIWFKHHKTKTGLGATINVGARYNWNNYTFVDIYFDYLHQHVKISDSEFFFENDDSHLDLGGYKVGLALGVYF